MAGMDFLLPQMFHQLITTYPDCNNTIDYKCMILNDNGKFILHSDAMENPDSQNINGKHITEKEYEIARSLIEKNVLKRQKCFSCKTTNDQYYWKLEMPENMPELTHHIYNISAVPETNIFLIKKYAWFKGGTRCDCSIKLDTSGTPACRLKDDCECPCHNNTSYDICENNFPVGQASDKALPCAPDQPGVNFTKVSEITKKEVKTLPVCHKPNCNLKTSKWLCEGTYLCGWCHGKCQSRDECQKDVETESMKSTSQPVSQNTTQTDEDLTTGHYIIIGFGVVALTILILVVVGLILKYKPRPCKTSSIEESNTPIAMPPRSIQSSMTDVSHESDTTYASPYAHKIQAPRIQAHSIPAQISLFLGQRMHIVANIFSHEKHNGTHVNPVEGGTGVGHPIAGAQHKDVLYDNATGSFHSRGTNHVGATFYRYPDISTEPNGIASTSPYDFPDTSSTSSTV